MAAKPSCMTFPFRVGTAEGEWFPSGPSRTARGGIHSRRMESKGSGMGYEYETRFGPAGEFKFSGSGPASGRTLGEQMGNVVDRLVRQSAERLPWLSQYALRVTITGGWCKPMARCVVEVSDGGRCYEICDVWNAEGVDPLRVDTVRPTRVFEYWADFSGRGRFISMGRQDGIGNTADECMRNAVDHAVKSIHVEAPHATRYTLRVELAEGADGARVRRRVVDVAIKDSMAYHRVIGKRWL